jgi:hypothetical protein
VSIVTVAKPSLRTGKGAGSAYEEENCTEERDTEASDETCSHLSATSLSHIQQSRRTQCEATEPLGARQAKCIERGLFLRVKQISHVQEVICKQTPPNTASSVCASKSVYAVSFSGSGSADDRRTEPSPRHLDRFDLFNCCVFNVSEKLEMKISECLCAAAAKDCCCGKSHARQARKRREATSLLGWRLRLETTLACRSQLPKPSLTAERN